MKRSNYLALLIALAFFIALIIGNNIELAYDESRHAMQSVFFKQYFVTLLSGDIMSLSKFLALYMQKNPVVGWYALYDPPFHAILQGIFFIIFGISQFVANASNAFIVSAFSIAFYLFAKTYFKDGKIALLCYVLFLFNPFTYSFARRNLVDLTACFTFLAWYYATFYTKARYLSFRFSKRLRLRFNIYSAIGALFLTASGLTKYPSMIFALAAMLVHLVYTAYKTRAQLKQQPFFSYLSSSGISSMVKKFIFQGIVFLLIAGWWLKFSLLDYQMYHKVFWAGSIVGREGQNLSYYLYYFIASIKELKYITLLSIIALFFIFKQKNADEETERKKVMALSILAILIIATAIISNRQLRYAIQFVPLLFVLSVEGLDYFTEWLSKIFKIKYLFLIACVAFLVYFIFGDVQAVNERLDIVGHSDYQLEDFIKNAKDPSYFMNIKGHGDFEGSKIVSGHSHKYTPDLFNFKLAKSSKNYDNPKLMTRYVEILDWHGTGLSDHPETVINNLVEISKQVNVYLVLFKFDRPDDNIISSLKDPLIQKGFQSKVMNYYIVLYKEKQ